MSPLVLSPCLIAVHDITIVGVGCVSPCTTLIHLQVPAGPLPVTQIVTHVSSLPLFYEDVL